MLNKNYLTAVFLGIGLMFYGSAIAPVSSAEHKV